MSGLTTYKTNKKKAEPPTWVCQKWGRIVGLSIWNSIEHYRKFEHWYFKFPTFGKPKTVRGNRMTTKQQTTVII